MTDTPAGLLRVTGLCIPWSGAHVSTGRQKRRRWEDHLSYLQGLAPVLKEAPSGPHLVLGDFNQTVLRSSQPVAASEALMAALDPQFELATAGVTDSCGHKAIDHLTHTRDLLVQVEMELSSRSPDGLHLSDHFGLVLDVYSRAPAVDLPSGRSGLSSVEEPMAMNVEEFDFEAMPGKVRLDGWPE